MTWYQCEYIAGKEDDSPDRRDWFVRLRRHIVIENLSMFLFSFRYQ